MNNMFFGCTIFNSDISNWDVSSVTDMNNMFYYVQNLIQIYQVGMSQKLQNIQIFIIIQVYQMNK